MRGSRRPRIPAVEWSASQLLCKTRRSIQSPNGAKQRFGMDRHPAEERLADLEVTRCVRSASTLAEYFASSRRSLTSRCRLDRAANLPPEELRRRQLAAMTAWVLAGARSQAAVVAVRGPTLGRPDFARPIARARRPRRASAAAPAWLRPVLSFARPGASVSHHSAQRDLAQPLGRAGVARMVGEISARHALSKEPIEGVSERTGGLPLFVEEVTRLLVERGEQGGAQVDPADPAAICARGATSIA